MSFVTTPSLHMSLQTHFFPYTVLVEWLGLYLKNKPRTNSFPVSIQTEHIKNINKMVNAVGGTYTKQFKRKHLGL